MQQNGDDIKHLVPTAGGQPDTSLCWGQGRTLSEVGNFDGLLDWAQSDTEPVWGT